MRILGLDGEPVRAAFSFPYREVFTISASTIFNASDIAVFSGENMLKNQFKSMEDAIRWCDERLTLPL